ncbi:MAG: hypothetical protein ACKVHO_14850 [Verrucomicrobiia bacterium]|jgi:hypothetical protein
MNPDEEVVQELSHAEVPGYREKFLALFALAIVYIAVIFIFGSAGTGGH